MTVKIVDKQLYEIYELVNTRTYSSETEDVISFVQLMAERMAPEDLNDNGDVGKIVKAIIDGESVEWHEIKYRVPMPRITAYSGLQVYLYRRYEGDFDIHALDNGTPSSFIFTMDEIPEEYRQWAEEVKE